MKIQLLTVILPVFLVPTQTWNIETVNSTGDVGCHTSLVLDSSGNPHISYTDITQTMIKVERALRLPCTMETWSPGASGIYGQGTDVGYLVPEQLLARDLV